MAGRHGMTATSLLVCSPRFLCIPLNIGCSPNVHHHGAHTTIEQDPRVTQANECRHSFLPGNEAVSVFRLVTMVLRLGLSNDPASWSSAA